MEMFFYIGVTVVVIAILISKYIPAVVRYTVGIITDIVSLGILLFSQMVFGAKIIIVISMAFFGLFWVARMNFFNPRKVDWEKTYIPEMLLAVGLFVIDIVLWN